ncbi:MAG: DUF2304 domain-containing protein [bacterium]|nr:DUF2304 domain-containing protein [bacterium]MDZ4248209.1 DUF2304 domain-containing protein [Patescibacteria group bacterium]
MIIQPLLIAGLLLVFIWFLRNRNQARTRAGKKLAFALLVLAGVIAVLYPDVMNTLAGWVGVGRGADLLFYALTLAFIFVTLNIYLKFQDHDRRLTEIVREVAIKEAEPPRKKQRRR